MEESAANFDNIKPQLEGPMRNTVIVKKPTGKFFMMDDKDEEIKNEQKSNGDFPQSKPTRESEILASKIVPDPNQDTRMTAFRNSLLDPAVNMRSSYITRESIKMTKKSVLDMLSD